MVVVVVMFASKDYFYEDDFSDLEFYISREEFDDNISNTFRYNVKFYEVSIIEPLTGVIVFIKLILTGNRKIENFSQLWSLLFV